MKVYGKIAAITADLSKIGISKDSKNSQQGYAFRGIDQVYGALSPLLAKHGLCILPRVTDRQVTERQNRNGGTLFYTTLTVEFDFVAAEDGSKHTIVTVGEAMDSGDKSSNKAMSASYKYAAFMAFCVPTEGDNDADASTHEVKPNQSRKILDAIASADSVKSITALYKMVTDDVRAAHLAEFQARRNEMMEQEKANV